MHVLAKRILVRKVDRQIIPHLQLRFGTGMSLDTGALQRRSRGSLQRPPEAHLSKSMERVYKLLVRTLASCTDQKVSSMFIGVHPANRDGVGVSARHVHDLLGRFSVARLVPDSEFRGICVEARRVVSVASIFKWNRRPRPAFRWANTRPSTLTCMLKYCTIAGSHTNQVLRCFQARVASSALQVSDGSNLNLDKLKALDSRLL